MSCRGRMEFTLALRLDALVPVRIEFGIFPLYGVLDDEQLPGVVELPVASDLALSCHGEQIWLEQEDLYGGSIDQTGEIAGKNQGVHHFPHFLVYAEEVFPECPEVAVLCFHEWQDGCRECQGGAVAVSALEDSAILLREESHSVVAFGRIPSFMEKWKEVA